MGNWVELAQSAFIALIFAFMLAKLISIVISFRDDNLRITRDVAPDFVPDTAEEAQSWTELQSVGKKRVPGNDAEENADKEGETVVKYGKTLRGEGLDAETLGKDGETVRNEGSDVQILEKGDEALRRKGLDVQTLGKVCEIPRSEGLDVQTPGKDGKTLISEDSEAQVLGKDDQNLKGKGLEVNTLAAGGKAPASEGLRDEFGAGSLHGESHLGEEEDDDWEGVESTELDEAFGAAASYIATLAGQSTERIPNDVQLQFYGLYKLATEGPCTAPQPSALKITARAKWHAWQRLGTMSPEAAMQKYIALLTDIRPSWADGMKQKSRKKDEESSHQSATKGPMGPVFSSFVNYEGSDDETKLEIIHSYASEGNTIGLLQVLEEGIPVDMKDSQGRTALHWAADRGHLKTLEILVSKGADVNSKLLCQFEPKSVLKFLESFENYRLEHCLRLCQDYGVTDAAAFLLERVGDVASALSLTISDVMERIQEMDSAVASMYEKSISSISSEDKPLNALLMMPEVDAVHGILVAAVGLCQRNTLRLDPQESENLWFRLLDMFSEPSRELYYHKKSLKVEKENYKKSQKEGLNSKASLRWKVINVGNSAYHLRRVFTHFIGEIIDGMMGYVPLPTIMSKLLSDNGSQEFGDFKATILGLLGTYGYERTILDTAKNLIEDDAYYNINMLRKGASHAYAPASSYCCICGRTLDKESFGSNIYIFHCGHAAHVQCETQDTIEIAKDSVGGCPICLPKKRSSPARRKMIEAQKEIVKEAYNSIQNQASSSKTLNENTLMERSFGVHPQSRFEMLNNLQKGQKSLNLGLLPNLRLAPPLVYHDLKAHSSSTGSKEETSNGKMKNGHLIRAQRTKGSSPFQFPLTSSIFGNDKNRKR